MTEYVETVDEQRKRIAEEKADKNIVMHYFQKGAGQHFRLTKYESGREMIENFNND